MITETLVVGSPEYYEEILEGVEDSDERVYSLLEEIREFINKEEDVGLNTQFDGRWYLETVSGERTDLSLDISRKLSVMDQILSGWYDYKNNRWETNKYYSIVRKWATDNDLCLRKGIGEKDSFGPVTTYVRLGSFVHLD